MKTLILSAVLFLFCCQWAHAYFVPRAESYCYSSDNVKPQVKRFTSKTPYQIAKGADFERQVAVPNCKPVKFWMLCRHGTRLPEADQIEALPDLKDLRKDILKNYNKNTIENGLCAEDLQLIDDWTLDKNITENKAQYLTTQGWDDLRILGEDYKRALPELFAEYDESKFLFRHTDTQRTEGSYKGFVEGVFGSGAHQMIKVTKAPSKDSLLTPFNYCQTWVDREDSKKGSDTEGGLFKKSDIMTETLERVSARLGFKKSLKYKQVKQLWDICRFETAWFLDKPSAWCTAFTIPDVLVFEYLDDLGKEYASGYSTDMNSNIACEIVQDLLNRLSSEDEPRVVAYFSHSALIQLFATALGIQKDSFLLKSSDFGFAANRKWRTSELDPFAANYAVVKYDCSDDPVDPSPKIGFFSNQRPLDFEGCRNGLCKLDDFVERYQKYSNANCNSVFCTNRAL